MPLALPSPGPGMSSCASFSPLLSPPLLAINGVPALLPLQTHPTLSLLWSPTPKRKTRSSAEGLAWSRSEEADLQKELEISCL